MPVLKIDHASIVKELLRAVTEIENSGLPQREKTTKFKAAAGRYINALYKDGRKFRGESGEKRRIGLSTARKYIKEARDKLEALNWKHHLLERELGRLKKRYPLHADVISQLDNQSSTETRLRHKGLSEQLGDAHTLASKVHSIDFSQKGAKRQVEALAAEFPMYEALLLDLNGKNAQQAFDTLDKALKEREALAADLPKLKISHEIMYHVVMPKEDANALKRTDAKALAKKKNNVVALDYKAYVTRIANMINNPSGCSSGGNLDAIAPLTFALCAVTGRRPIEVLLQGEFKAIGKYKIEFTGQAKKRFAEERDQARWFYSLVEADKVVAAFKYLREMDKVAELSISIPRDGELRTANQIVNSRTTSALNKYTKEFFNDKARTLKDTRGIWARIVYTQWFDSDPHWKGKDEDVFFSAMLGHANEHGEGDSRSQLFYKSFKLHGVSRSFKPEIIEKKNRLEALAELDDKMPELAQGDAAVTLHNEVKALLEAEPDAKISQSLLINAPFNGYRPMVKRYLATCADALEIELVGNRWKPKAIADQTPVMIEVDASTLDNQDEVLEAPEEEMEEELVEEVAETPEEPEEETEPEPAPAKVEKPAPTKGSMRAPKPKISSFFMGDDLWIGRVMIGTKVVGTAEANDDKSARALAWRKYEDENAVMTTVKENGWWKIEFVLGGYSLLEECFKGGPKKQAEQMARAAFKNRD